MNEYLCLWIKMVGDATINDRMNILAVDGWEPFMAADDRLYFRRPKSSATKQPTPTKKATKK